MRRTTARPSDIYRLPEHARQAPPHLHTQPEPTPPRFPGWMGVAGVVAVVLVMAGVFRATTVANTGDTQLVDVVSEDQAVAALALYGAQAGTIEQLRVREDIFASPGPGDTAAVAARGVQNIQHALNEARNTGGADPLAAGYWNSGAHSDVIEELRRLAEQAELIAVLASTHDTLYGGGASISLHEARDRLVGAFSRSGRPEPLANWAQALLEQMEDRDRQQQALAARDATGALWAFEVKRVEPAAKRLVHNYVSQLPPTTISAMRGHPVAGPALALLERDRGPIG